jgi:type I restriction enzyme S subunit
VKPSFSTLGDVAEFINGAAFKPEDWGEEGARIIRIQNLTDPTKPYNRTTRQIHARLHVHPGDILVSWSATLGVFEWRGPDIGLLNQHIFRVLPDESKVEKRYLLHALALALVDMQQHLHGATMMHVNRGEFLATRLYLPPLHEQRRIAAILDQADALRAKRRAALAQLDEMARAIFVEMFGDPAQNPLGWNMRKLGDLIIAKPNNGIFKKNTEYGEGLPVVWVEQLFRGNQIDLTDARRLKLTEREIEQYALKHGDILFCRSSLKLSGIGFNNVYLSEDNRAIFECHLIRISPDKSRITPAFLNFVLRMPNQRQKLFKYAKTVTMSTIDQYGLKQITVPVPPLARQNSFIERLQKLEQLHAQSSQELSRSEELFASLQNRAFRGEL